MRVEWLKAFRAVMQAGTVTGAAKVVLRSQPQISRMIAGLEESLGFQLFTREGRRLIPTHEGLLFHEHIKPLLINFDSLAEIADDIRSKRGHPIIISAEPFLLHALIPEAVQEMVHSDQTKFSIDICSRESGFWMSRSNADLGVVALPFVQTDMDRQAFAEAELVAVLPPQHPLGSRETIDIAQLAREKFIGLRTSSTLLRAQIDIAAVRCGATFKPVIETASGVTACEMVAHGLGVTIADPIVGRSFEPRGVIVRRLLPKLHLTYGLLSGRGGIPPERIGRVIQIITNAALRLGGEYIAVSQRNNTEVDQPVRAATG